jgi:RNA polymerase sigma factor (sigma-70 family)
VRFITTGIRVADGATQTPRSSSMSQKDQLRQSLESHFEALRPILQVVATNIVGPDSASDVVQEAFYKLWKTASRDSLTDAYLRATVRTIALDIVRTRSRRAKLMAHAFSDLMPDSEGNEPRIGGQEIPSDALDCLSPAERSVLLSKVEHQLPYSEIICQLGLTYAAARKSLQRAVLKVQSRLAFRSLIEGRLDELNTCRLKQSHAVHVARWCRSEPASLEYLFGALGRKDLNKAVKNVTLILAQLLPRGWAPTNEVERQLKKHLAGGDLYRGQKMYIAEALLDRRYRQQIYFVAREFLACLNELEDRPVNRHLTQSEMSLTNPIDIFDVKSVHPLGGEVKPGLVQFLRRQYEAGEGSPDLRRCVAFQLQRTQVAEPEHLKWLITGLYTEPDQMNAIYTVKFIRKQAITRHPHLVYEACQATEVCARRWPQNTYLATSCDWLRSRLKHVT